MYGLIVANFNVSWEQLLFKFVLRKPCWKGGQKSVFGSSLERVIICRSCYNSWTTSAVIFCLITVPKSQISVLHQVMSKEKLKTTFLLLQMYLCDKSYCLVYQNHLKSHHMLPDAFD